jgi:hypothetical protein
MLKTNPSTLFTLSLSPLILTYLVVALVCLLIGTLRFVLPSIVPIGLLVTILPVAVFAAGLVACWAQPIRSAQFYEDGFRIVGRGLDRDLSYSDITRASLVNEPTPFLPHRRISINTNQNDTLVVWGNPTSSKLGLDLYSWLSSKTAHG